MALSYFLVIVGEARGLTGFRKFGFGFSDPLVELFLAHHFHRDRHEGMAGAAQFGALAVENAGLGGLDLEGDRLALGGDDQDLLDGQRTAASHLDGGAGTDRRAVRLDDRDAVVEFLGLRGARRRIFFDLADPEKRTREDITRAMQLIGRFSAHFDVIVGLNEKEAGEVAHALGLPSSERTPEANSADLPSCM